MPHTDGRAYGYSGEPATAPPASPYPAFEKPRAQGQGQAQVVAPGLQTQPWVGPLSLFANNNMAVLQFVLCLHVAHPASGVRHAWQICAGQEAEIFFRAQHIRLCARGPCTSHVCPFVHISVLKQRSLCARFKHHAHRCVHAAMLALSFNEFQWATPDVMQAGHPSWAHAIKSSASVALQRVWPTSATQRCAKGPGPQWRNIATTRQSAARCAQTLRMGCFLLHSLVAPGTHIAMP